jgi:prevent-host-death family protein
MSTPEPTVRIVDASEAARTLNELLDDVSQTNSRVVVEKGGMPVAAVISAADLERFRRLEEQRKRDFEVVKRMQEAFAGVPFEEIEREAAKALAEVRAEIRQERLSAENMPG